MGDMNLPFEAQEPTPFTDTDYLIASGVVIMATVVSVPGARDVMPGLVFRFAKPDGTGFHQATMLVASSAELMALRPLVDQAVITAHVAASNAQAGGQ